MQAKRRRENQVTKKTPTLSKREVRETQGGGRKKKTASWFHNVSTRQ